MTLDLEEIVSAIIAIGPLVCAVIGFRVARRGHWASVVLAAPALLLGLALIAALFNNAAGYGVLAVLIYAPILLILGCATLLRWYMRRSSRE